MNRLLAIPLGLLLTAVSAAGSAASGQPTELAVSRTAEVRQNALELARLLNPAEPFISAAGRSFDDAFDKRLAAEGGADELEKGYPGFIAELRTAIREATLADLRSDLPTFHERYARVFAESFTAEELGELIAFYRTPAGGRIIQSKFANIDVSNVIDRIGDDPDGKVSAGDVQAIGRQAGAGTLKDMSAEDFQAVMLFGLRPVARKLRDAAPRLAEVEAEIANEPDPALDQAIEAASQKVYQRFGLEVPAE